MDDSDKIRDMAIVAKAIDGLAEHFDTVQVFCSRHDASGKEGETMNLNMGRGNWYARYGHVKWWMIRNDENCRIEERKAE